MARNIIAGMSCLGTSLNFMSRDLLDTHFLGRFWRFRDTLCSRQNRVTAPRGASSGPKAMMRRRSVRDGLCVIPYRAGSASRCRTKPSRRGAITKVSEVLRQNCQIGNETLHVGCDTPVLAFKNHRPNPCKPERRKSRSSASQLQHD